MIGFIISTIVMAITFAIVSTVLPQSMIDYGGDVQTLLIVAVIAGLVNALIKPIVTMLALPLTLVTMGAIGFVINAALLLLVAWISDTVGLDFSVGGFPPDFTSDTAIAALIGGFAIGIVSSILGMVLPKR